MINNSIIIKAILINYDDYIIIYLNNIIWTFTINK